MSGKNKSVLDEAERNYKLGRENYRKQLTKEKEDLKFQVPDLQWDDEAKRQRQGGQQGGVPVPARPCLSISKLDQPIQLVYNQMQSAHLGVNIHPLTEDADDETAEVLQGLYRKIERDSRADLARSWAFDRAIKAGRGAYRVNTAYDEESGHPFDQKITIERILYQDAVIFDPSATLPDYSDGKWAFVTSWMPKEDFERKYPKAEVPDVDAMGDLADSQTPPDWVKADGERVSVLVAEYWRKEVTLEKICLLADGRVCTAEEVGPEDVIEQMRDREATSVMFYKLAPGGEGLQELECQEWNGSYIPLIPVIGRELQPFDNERRWQGIIGPAKDAQRLYNYSASNAVEMVALIPKAPWIMMEGQDEDYESMWQQANIRNFSALKYKPVSIGGVQAPPPQRVQAEASGLMPMMELLHQADDFIQSTTSTPDPALGNLNSRDRSGKAIQSLQAQSEASKSNYLQNLAQISMTLEAKIVLDLIPNLYDRPGRVARILDFEDNSEEVMLNAPFTTDPVTKRAKRANQGPPMPPQMMQPSPMTTSGAAPMPPQMGMGPQGMPQAPKPMPKPKTFDLTKGRYGVTIDIGKSYQSRLEQGADEIGQILQASPELMPLIGPIYFKFRDFPGSTEIAEVLKKVQAQTHPGLDDKEGEDSIEGLQAKLQQSQAQIQQMQQAGQELQQQIQTDQAKQQATMAKAQMDAQVETQRLQLEFEKAKMDNATKIEVANIAAKSRMSQTELEAAISIALDRSKKEQEAFNRAHAADLKHTDLAHQVAMGMQSQEHEQGMAERGHEQGMESQDLSHRQSLEQQQAAAEAESAQEDASEGSEE